MKQKTLFDQKTIPEEEIDRAQNLLWSLIQGGGKIQVDVDSEKILVSPVDLAMKFGDQIRAAKPALIQIFREAHEIWERGEKG